MTKLENAYTVIGSMVLAVLLIFTAAVCQASTIVPKEVYCVIGEAEGEGAIGMEAVAEAIRNRGHIKGVYGCNSKRVQKKLYSQKTLDIATRAWEQSAGGDDITGGATHWEGTAFKTPYWAKDMIVTATIGRQRFYKEK